MERIIWKHGTIMCLGCGPGSPLYLTPLVVQYANMADVLVGCPRTLTLFRETGGQQIALDRNLDALVEKVVALLAQGKQVAWLCTGDTGVFSVAATMRRRLGSSRVACVPGISSVQVACARLGTDLTDVQILSAHGRNLQIQMLNQEMDQILLAGSISSLQEIMDICNLHMGTHQLFVCADLGLDSEIIENVTVESIAEWVSHPRVLFYLRRNVV